MAPSSAVQGGQYDPQYQACGIRVDNTTKLRGGKLKGDELKPAR